MLDIAARVREIIAEELGATMDAVVEEASFAGDLGADSLDTVEIIMSLEEEFDIVVDDNDAESLTTVGAVIEYIQRMVES